MDCCGCCKRDHRLDATEVQQRCATAAASPVRNQACKKGLIPADGKWLWRYNSRSSLETVRRAIQRQKFYATLPHKIDAEVSKVADVIDMELERIKRRPRYTEELQGDTPLGGEMRLTHDFDDDDPEPPSAA